MKSTTSIFGLLALATLVAVENSFGQGFVFNNFGTSGGARARVFGVEPENPHRQLWGNGPEASPPGTQIYSGAPLLGTNYNVEAWYSLMPVPDVFALNTSARPVQDSLTYFGFSEFPGFFIRGQLFIPDALRNPSSPPGDPYMAYLQVRAWDNAGGRFASWDQARQAAQAGSGQAVGWSTTFEQGLSIGASTYPGLQNFQSFNLFIVPEPSAIVLALLASLTLLGSLRPRRRSRKPT